MPWNGVHHIHLICEPSKEEETIEFYTEVMGFDLQRRLDLPDGRRTFFFDDGTYNHIYFWTLDEDSEHTVKPKRQAPFGIKSQMGEAERPYEFLTGIHHLSWGVQSENELLEIKDKLQGYGAPVWGPINRSNLAYELYFEDPNGINLELHTPGANTDAKGVYKTTVEGTEEKKEVTVNQVSEGTVIEGSEDGIAKRFSNTFWTE